MSDRKIFISHSSRDKAIAEKIASALRDIRTPQKIRTTLYENVKKGEDFGESIYKTLQDSDAILVVAASPEAVSSSWVSYEIGMAESLSKPVILLASNRYSRSDFREDFKSFPMITFDAEKPEGVAQEIAERMASVDKKK